MEYRKKFEVYGRTDLKQDIYLCHEISEIYRVKKNYVEFNKWFREEMVLRYDCCDIGIKNKIKDLMGEAETLRKDNHTEDALRQYEEASHLIESHIDAESDKYAVLQLEMGKLFLEGYTQPRYDLALDCFQKVIEIKRKYMSDIPRELEDTFQDALPSIRKLCRISIANIEKEYREFSEKRGTLNINNRADFQLIVKFRDTVLDMCYMVLPLFEEAYNVDSLELAELYRFVGEAYKWCPVNTEGCRLAAAYLIKLANVWENYKDNRAIQTNLAHVLVDIGGTYVMQRDYESALVYRLKALKTIWEVKDVDMEDVGSIELALMKVYEETKQSRTIPFRRFLEDNGLSASVESFQIQHLGNGWANFKVKIRGIEKMYNLKMSE